MGLTNGGQISLEFVDEESLVIFLDYLRTHHGYRSVNAGEKVDIYSPPDRNPRLVDVPLTNRDEPVGSIPLGEYPISLRLTKMPCGLPNRGFEEKVKQYSDHEIQSPPER